MSVPETGDIDIIVDFTLQDLNNGEKRIVSQETGVSMQQLFRAIQAAEGKMADADGFDVADIEYALGRIGLRRTYGVEADTPSNADRVTLTMAVGVDPTPAAGD